MKTYTKCRLINGTSILDVIHETKTNTTQPFTLDPAIEPDHCFRPHPARLVIAITLVRPRRLHSWMHHYTDGLIEQLILVVIVPYQGVRLHVWAINLKIM